MASLSCCHRSVGQTLIGEKLVACQCVAFHICSFSHTPHKLCYSPCLGGAVHVKSGQTGFSVGACAVIEVAVMFSDAVEYIGRRVAVGAFALERVALHNKQCIAIPPGYLGAFPSQQVMVDVAAPTGRYTRYALVGQSAVHYCDDAPVGSLAHTAYVDPDDIALSGTTLRVILRHFPYAKSATAVRQKLQADKRACTGKASA